jgi:putative FmdB family regulatory protein
MPIYEYEPEDRECLMCEGRVEVLQAVDDAPLEFCPYCGLGVQRVISRASIKVSRTPDAEAAAKKGFTTFRRAGKGVWEKVAGPREPAKGDRVLNVDEATENGD